MTRVKLVVSILSGVVAGIAIGILFAPNTGKRTRRQIVLAGGDLTEGIKTKFHQLGEFIQEKLDGTKGVYSHFISLGKAKT
jgi:gas vesicle protein